MHIILPSRDLTALVWTVYCRKDFVGNLTAASFVVLVLVPVVAYKYSVNCSEFHAPSCCKPLIAFAENSL